MRDIRTISVVICTRNRAKSLARTLKSFSESQHDRQQTKLEVFVVDNGSTDDTAQVAAEWFSTWDGTGEYIFENRPGVSRCKNIALRKAAGEVIFLTDDDCVLAPDCLTSLQRFSQSQDGPFLVGGRVELGDPNDYPVTIITNTQPATVSKSGYPGGALLGANFVISADAYKMIGDFDEALGPGAPYIAAEDAEYILRATGLDIPVYYEPSILVYHYHGRREQADAAKLLKGYYFGDGAVYAKHLFSDKRILTAIWGDLKFAVKCIFVNVRSIEGVNRVGLFKLFHKARGFSSYILNRPT